MISTNVAKAKIAPGGGPGVGHVALTFGDGPDPVWTPHIVDALADADVRATFFVVGERLARHRWLGRLLASAGHELAVHGWRHAPIVPGPVGRRALLHTVEVVTDVTGVVPRWFRPPYGLALPGTRKLAREAGLELVRCSDPESDPWAAPPSAGILRRVAASLRGGATVLLHDRTRAGLAAVPLVVALCHRRGLRVGPLGEHGVHRAG